jgi:hypothetical protein
MEKQIFQEKIRALREALHKRNSHGLKNFADECAELAMLESDERFVILSAIAYSFAKFFEKPYIESTKEFAELEETVQFNLAKAAGLLGSGDAKGLGDVLTQTEGKIRDLSSSLGHYIINIADKSRLKTGSQLYAHGASLGLAVRLARVDKDELANYIGHTTIPDKYRTISVAERLKTARDALYGAV